MKKQLFYGIIASVFVFNSCSNDVEVVEPFQESAPVQQEPLSQAEINRAIDEALNLTGRFDWNEASNHLLWSAVVRGNNILTVGYGSSENTFQRQNDSGQDKIKSTLLATIAEAEDWSENNKKSQVFFEDEVLTLFDVNVTSLETIALLRESEGVRYLEPSGYRYFQTEQTKSGGSGCGTEAEALNSNDYRTIAPNAKVPWSFDIHKIPQAWSYATGSGITIGIVDTGITPSNSLFGNAFNDGFSSGRFVQKYGTFVDSVWPWASQTDGPDDQCGHGTSMIAVAAAPRNDNGKPVGVAYNANLISYRAASNVVLDGYHEQRGVASAFTALANRSDVKIISMSMGHIFSVGRIEDAIRYAHSRGKLIFCAGGTSTSFTNFVGVIFPASMNETVAVTGIEEGRYRECDTCHKGSKIDFTVSMERGNNNHIPILGFGENQTDYVGGSSVATATTAGIAALVWSRNPSWNRTQVLNKLIQSAEFYPNRNGDFGWGNIDALKAVR